MKRRLSWDWVGLILIVLLNISLWLELDSILRNLNWIIIISLLCFIIIRRIFDWKTSLLLSLLSFLFSQSARFTIGDGVH